MKYECKSTKEEEEKKGIAFNYLRFNKVLLFQININDNKPGFFGEKI